VTTYLETLEIRGKSGNQKLVREKDKVRELGKGRKGQGKLGFLKLLFRITSAEGDDVKAKCAELCAIAKTNHKETFETFTRDQRLDVFYAKLLIINRDHYRKLSKWF